MSKDPSMWMVRAGEGAYMIEDFLEKELTAIGWAGVGDLSKVTDVDTIKAKLRQAYPEFKDGQINNFAGQLFRFRNEFTKGQLVVTYNPNDRVYWIGEITSDYEYNPKLIDAYPHIRKVKWKQSVSRDQLLTGSKNSLGSTLTIFKIPSLVVQELLGEKPSTEERAQAAEAPDQTLEIIKEDIVGRANEFIKDKIIKLDWEEMQDLVAGILRGMGYKTLVSPKGNDRGRDIMASPDGLGLENPKIMVEVKHRGGTMGGPEIRAFLGVLRPSDRGIYVSTGGFTKDAKYEAERAIIPLTLIDLDMLVLLITQHYDKFDIETRALIPLKKLYWPLDN